MGRERGLRLLGVRGSSGAFITARLQAEHDGTLLVIAPGPARAERLAQDLRTFSGGASVQLFPAYDTPPFDRFSPHPEIEARRMSLLYQLLCAESEPGLTLVAPWSALMRRVPPRDELRARVTHLERGMTVDRDALLDVLVAAGYHRTALVEERGEVASRGGILDLFPPQLEQPARLEFDFEEIGSIRLFDASTQRSDLELRSLVAIPPRPFRLQAAHLDDLIQRVRARGRAQRVPESNVYAITEALARRHAPPGLENLEALLHERMETLFDYLPPQTLIVVDDPEAGRSDAAAVHEEVVQAEAAARRQDRLICSAADLYLEDGAVWEAVTGRQPVLLDALGAPDAAAREDVLEVGAGDHRALRSEVLERRGSGRALEPLSTRLVRWQEQGLSVRIACPTLSAAERFADILRDYGHELPLASGAGADWEAPPPPGQPEIAVASLHEGFELPGEGLVVLTEEDVFGARVQRRMPRPLRAGQAIDRLAQIQGGDYLVHTEHGIGRYGGLTQLQLGGVRQEFLLLHYDQGDKLYLPISRLAQVQRYTASDEQPPFLDRLGGQRWARAKRKVKRAVRDMAKELVAIYAAREVLAGHGVPIGSADYEEFEASFPYEDTPDQRRSTQEVLADLAKERSMDRLVCGDVGFGKTEIACRAAYAVAAEGRQVAFLVPTTVLCQQHLQTLRERFAETPIEVAALSRLSSPADARAVREGLSSGRIDIVVGTHRLLSRDVRFRNLGLLIIDEEHRFGVTHKEKLKQLRKLVDVLTLSATPIPRTLEMALSGLRDLSVISTPPPDRTAIRTQICRRSDDVAQDAIRRELRRGGQVFVVHNRVETIGEFARYIGSLVPEARIAIAHGQMAGRELEGVMLSFLERKFDVLVCTSIIESGLDIPNANTILIDRADRFGLAQLYQLRGRVGRSERRAHAYLFLPAEGELTDDARRRIEAIQDLSELGAGFRLAMSDLEIRGAGNLLGANQSGHIHAVGYDLYVEMLERAVAELRGESVDDEVEPEIRLPIPALLPEAYVSDVNQRLVLYKQLSSARDETELRELRADLLDRFGPLPSEAETLLEVIRLKIGCRRLGIASVSTEGRELVLRVADRTRIDPNRLLRVINRPGSPYRVTPEQRIHLKLRKAEDALAESFGALELLGAEPGEPVAAPPRDARDSIEGSA
jgi:transcription-repair coupling factor (superfamily II helicase)